MPDLDSRLRSVDRLEPPDLWPAIRERRPEDEPSTSGEGPGRRILVAVLALVVSAAAIGLAVRVFRGHPVHPPVGSPTTLECTDLMHPVPHPDPGAADGSLAFDGLEDVVSFGPDDAWAVGSSGVTSTLETVPTATILHWNGRGWSNVEPALIHTRVGVIPAPGGPTTRPVSGRFGTLSSVAGTSSADIWTVGGAGREPLIEHWDGVRWNRVPAASGADAPGFLDAVAVVSPDDAWAVGEGDRELIEHWDGSSWTTVPSGVRGWLTSVSAAGPNDVWAVGTDPRQRHTISLHWDGRSWTRVPIQEPAGASYRMLRSVLAVSSNNVWAVGSSSPIGNRVVPGIGLIEHWDGSRWRAVPWVPPSPDVNLNVVASDGSGEIWIGGFQLMLRPRHVESLLLRLEAGGFHSMKGLGAGRIAGIAPNGRGGMWATGTSYRLDPEGVSSAIDRRVCGN